MDANRPDAVVLAAGRVGGIFANSSQPADFIYDNLAIATNVIHAAKRCGVARLLKTNGTPSPRSPASSCVRRTAFSMAAISSPRCRLTSTDRATISIR